MVLNLNPVYLQLQLDEEARRLCFEDYINDYYYFSSPFFIFSTIYGPNVVECPFVQAFLYYIIIGGNGIMECYITTCAILDNLESLILM